MTRDWIPALAAIARRHPPVVLYVFGSTIRDGRAPNDLDLLVVYSTIGGYYAFSAELDQLEFSPLVDVVAMASDEVRSSGFIQRSNAIPIDELVAGYGEDAVTRGGR